MRTIRGAAGLGLVLLGCALAGCRGEAASPTREARRAETDKLVQARWGRTLDQLPVEVLVAYTPNNANIKDEFEWAFSDHCAVQFGHRVRIDWLDVGGGTNSIVTAIRNGYKDPVHGSCGVDIFWGGGEFPFRGLSRDGLLEPVALDAETLASIPADLGGVALREPAIDPATNQPSPEKVLWCGSAISGFGILYNQGLLDMLQVAPPATWDDLGEMRFADLLSLADPTQSGSAAAAYQAIAQSGQDWPEGWAKLLSLLANAKRFTDSAGTTANAPLVGEAPVATCIDFYGVLRVVEGRGELVYISPRGQTPFTPDPIAVLKNPPHRELAEKFVRFVLSPAGQALWPLPAGTAHGPASYNLCRQPIRKDVYELYGQQFLPRIAFPYAAGAAMDMTNDRTQVDYGVLIRLVQAAAIDNPDGLRRARDRLNATGRPTEKMAEFYRLPDDADTLLELQAVRKALKDKVQADRILTDWTTFFREKYRRLAP